MEQVLRKAIIEAEAYELMRAYDVETDATFDFQERADDFYITLLTQLLDLLDDLEHNADSQKREEIRHSLSEVARGLIVYSETYTCEEFEGVNRTNNHLFVAAIYYICGYEAIATLLLKNYRIGNYASNAAKLMFYIISGCRTTKDEHRTFSHLLSYFDDYLITGNEVVFGFIVEFYEKKVGASNFSSLRDFFDSTILLHVLHKFQACNIWADLKRLDPDTDWREYVDYSKSEHILSFLPSQRDALGRGLLTFEHSFSLGLATSGGKSYITELLIYQELKRNAEAKILYLAPLRSLSRELKVRFRKVGRKLDFKFACKYGGNVLDEGDSSLEDAQLLVSTPETFITLEGVLDEELRKYSLIICDEGQLLDDVGRGINYELLLTRLRQQNDKRFLFLSAIIPNIEDINVWLGGEASEVGKSKYRPCELRYGIAKQANGAINLEVWNRNLDAINYTITEFVGKNLCAGRIARKTGVTCMAALKSLVAGPVMIYSSTKYNKVGCVMVGSKLNEIVSGIKILNPKYYSKKTEFLDDVKEYVGYLLGVDYPLVEYIGNGFAYHHGDLPQDIREVIENAYANSALPLIISTSTLAEGVNMPIKTLVLHNLLSPMNYNPPRYMEVSSVKNIVGRVGRAGQQKYGLVIVPESDKGYAEELVRKALKSEGINPINGTLYRLITLLRMHKWQSASLEQINVLLEKEGLVEGIDLMITRNAADVTIEHVNVDEICKTSLAYKMGSVSDREMLTKVFEARYLRISEMTSEGDYEIFLETGLSLAKYKTLGDKVTDDDVEQLGEFDVTKQDVFLHYIALRLQEIGLVEESKNIDSFVKVAVSYMQGKTYVETAKEVGLTVDEVLLLTNYLQNNFADNIRSFVAYIKKRFIVENDFLDEWPEYLKYGIWTPFQYELVTKRLSDHTAVHGISCYVHDVLHSEWIDPLVLAYNMESILAFLHEKGYPKLTIERVERWLKS